MTAVDFTLTGAAAVVVAALALLTFVAVTAIRAIVQLVRYIAAPDRSESPVRPDLDPSRTDTPDDR